MEYESYLHLDYANSFGESYTPIRLELSKGIILKRKIHDLNMYDAMGSYPLLFCKDWGNLHEDIVGNKNQLVSLAAVTDPFGKYDLDYLKICFNTLVIPYKEHFVTDLSRTSESFVSKHNRRYAKKAMKMLSIIESTNPIDLSDTWCGLYSNLVKRHSIKGITNFSKESLVRQLSVPGSTVLYAMYEGEVIGMTIWYKLGNVAYYHLGAYSDKGYEMRASYAIFWNAIEYFRFTGLKWLNLGAGAGVKSNVKDGLSYFKKGWSTDSRMAYFCGHIFNKGQYEKISKLQGDYKTSYFPKYRLGEFD